ncbi:MAG TPA: DUF6602 domain-containing protein [Longimicrobiaceae bacterium]|jgi:hypothetical protein|nr:DUF6602 domain-containing protein [Longimicrobiaceae bacterium]
MPTNDLFDYMREATHDLQREYERIQKRATEDPGTAGDNGEENWAELLRRWLPSTYHVVTKGRIMDPAGKCGPQVDVLVLSSAYPRALLNKKEYLAGGVLAAFECKLRLKAEHIRRTVESAAEMRRLTSSSPKATPYAELTGPFLYGLLAHSHAWHGTRSAPVSNINEHLQEAERISVQHPKELIDVLCISDLGTWSTSRMITAGKHLLGPPKMRYGTQQDLWTDIHAAGGLVETTTFCFAKPYQSSAETPNLFTPIGSFLTTLLEKLAWRDTSLRELAEYFNATNLLGPGQGALRPWPLSILSPEVRVRLQQGHLSVGKRWDEWGMVQI